MGITENVYLGWGNPRKAGRVAGHDIAILIKGDEAVALQGGLARAFLKDVTDLTHHLHGISKNPNARRILRSVDPHPHDHHAYDLVFDTHWERACRNAIEPARDETEIRDDIGAGTALKGW